LTFREIWSYAEQILTEELSAEEARRDARLLIMYLLGISSARFYTYTDYPFPENLEIPLMSALQSRLTGMPLQYITQRQEFFGFSFAVGPGVLIPRPETEHLVEYALTLCDKGRIIRIADLGCGSCCIAISLALTLPKEVKVQIEAIERAWKAVQWAQRNLEHHDVGHRVRLIHGDLEWTLQGKYDLLLSNPPYISSEALTTLPREIREFEPLEALNGGIDGLSYYPILSDLAVRHLAPGGSLVLEVGIGQSWRVSEILSQSGLQDVHVIDDYSGVTRIVAAKLP